MTVSSGSDPARCHSRVEGDMPKRVLDILSRLWAEEDVVVRSPSEWVCGLAWVVQCTGRR